MSKRLMPTAAGKSEANNLIQTWREHMVDVVLGALALLAGIAYLPSMWLSVAFEQWVVAIVGTVAYVGVALLHWRRDSLPRRVRAFAFSRRQKPEHQPLHLNASINETLQLLRATLPRMVHLTVNTAAIRGVVVIAERRHVD